MANVRVRIKFDADIVIEGNSLKDCRSKWENLPLFSADALDLGVEYGETLLVEDAETYEDLSKEW